jgi:uncharacterized membrane protein
MIHMEGEVAVHRPVETVFDFVADARNEPRYNPHIRLAEKTSGGPIGVGSRFRNETASMGRITEWVIEITSYRRPWHLATSLHSSAMDIDGTMTFEAVPGGTRMRWSWDLKPRGIFQLFAPLIRRSGQRLEDDNWQNLKDYLESQDAPAERG